MSDRPTSLNAAAGLLLVLLGSILAANDSRAGDPPDVATILYSAAPWDGAAYDIHIPLKKTPEASDPVISINLWGNPEFAKPTTIRFTGKEDSGGGPGKGSGRAMYQSVLNNSWPENLSGSISFKSLKHDQTVVATYELTTEKGKKFKGSIRAKWGNKPSDARGG